MSRLPRIGLAAVSLVAAGALVASAQEEPFSVRLGLAGAPPEKVMPAVNNAALAAEDAAVKPFPPQPLRFAFTHDVKITLAQGRWDLVGDRWVWRVNITSRGAKSINLGFTRYFMPEGGRLYVYRTGYAGGAPRSVRSFGSEQNESHGQLWTPIVEATSVVVEAAVPEASRAQLQLELTKVNHAYRSFRKEDDITIQSGSCNVDVVCPEGDPYRNEIRSVGVLSINGSRLCTGSAINNTGTKKPLFITADHCGLRSTNAASVVVYWNFQNSWCRPVGSTASGGSGDGSLSQFNSGSFFRATWPTSDVTVVELDDAPQSAFNVFLAGWDRRAGPFTDGAVGIHHPGVDEKRISLSHEPTQDDAGTHHKIWWRPSGIGVTEPGSSGSPIYTKQGRFIGQLTGGGSACGVANSSMWDVYGKLSRSWDGGGTTTTRVRDYLDPLGTAPLMIDGRNWNDGTNTPTPTPTSPSATATPTPTPTPTPGTGSPNLALNKPATGSTPCNVNEGPEKAVNGSVSGGNSDKWCSTAATKFLQVDLGAAVSVDRFVVKHAGAGGESTTYNTRDFNVQTSTDNATWSTAVTVTANTASTSTHTVAARTARYVRLNVTMAQQTSNTAARIYELEVYAPSGVTPTPTPTPTPTATPTAPPAGNLALNKPATGSASCNTSETPAKAVNGSVTGGTTDKFCSLATTKFLQVDLGASFTVDTFVVKHAGAGGESTSWNTRDFNIQTSTDNATWSAAATVTGNTASTSTHAVAARTARYVRLNITAAEQAGGGAARIYEFEVYQ